MQKFSDLPHLTATIFTRYTVLYIPDDHKNFQFIKRGIWIKGEKL